jgi:hypothetical protein
MDAIGYAVRESGRPSAAEVSDIPKAGNELLAIPSRERISDDTIGKLFFVIFFQQVH